MKAELLHTFEADRRGVTAVRFDRDGRTVLTGGMGGHLARWDTAHWIRLEATDAHDKAVRAIDAGPDDVVTVGDDRAVRVWRGGSGRAAYALRRRVAARMGPMAVHLATVTSRGRVCVHRLDSGAELGRMPTVDERLGPLAWTPGGSALLVGGEGRVHRFHPFSGERVATHDAPDGPVAHLEFGGDDAGFAAISADGTLALWSTAGQRRHTIDTEGAAPGGLSFSPDGSRLAVSLAYQIQIRDTDSGRLLTRIKSVIKGIFGLHWAPDGRRLACGSADGRVRVWAIDP